MSTTSGRQLAAVLLLVAACLVVVCGLGVGAAEGEDTVWLHIPLGVALVALAAQAHRLARRLPELLHPQAERTRHD